MHTIWRQELANGAGRKSHTPAINTARLHILNLPLIIGLVFFRRQIQSNNDRLSRARVVLLSIHRDSENCWKLLSCNCTTAQLKDPHSSERGEQDEIDFTRSQTMTRTINPAPSSNRISPVTRRTQRTCSSFNQLRRPLASSTFMQSVTTIVPNMPTKNQIASLLPA